MNKFMDGAEAVVMELKRRKQQEPQDYVFIGGDIDFVMNKTSKALAITTPSKRRSGLLTIQEAVLKGQGIDLQIIEEAEVLRSPKRVVDRLLGG